MHQPLTIWKSLLKNIYLGSGQLFTHLNVWPFGNFLLTINCPSWILKYILPLLPKAPSFWTLQMTVRYHSTNVYSVCLKGELIVCFSFKDRSLICFSDPQEQRHRFCLQKTSTGNVLFGFSLLSLGRQSSPPSFCIYFVAL